MSRLMQRKQEWARRYGALRDQQIKALIRQRRELGRDERTRLLAAAQRLLEADRACAFAGIADGRSPGNKRAWARASDAEQRALAHFASLAPEVEVSGVGDWIDSRSAERLRERAAELSGVADVAA